MNEEILKNGTFSSVLQIYLRLVSWTMDGSLGTLCSKMKWSKKKGRSGSSKTLGWEMKKSKKESIWFIEGVRERKEREEKTMNVFMSRHRVYTTGASQARCPGENQSGSSSTNLPTKKSVTDASPVLTSSRNFGSFCALLLSFSHLVASFCCFLMCVHEPSTDPGFVHWPKVYGFLNLFLSIYDMFWRLERVLGVWNTIPTIGTPSDVFEPNGKMKSTLIKCRIRVKYRAFNFRTTRTHSGARIRCDIDPRKGWLRLLFLHRGGICTRKKKTIYLFNSLKKFYFRFVMWNNYSLIKIYHWHDTKIRI